MKRCLYKVLHTTICHGYEDGTKVWVHAGEGIWLTEEEAEKLAGNVLKVEERENTLTGTTKKRET
jgi:hypothetical protein